MKNISLLMILSTTGILGCSSDKTLTPCSSDIEVGLFAPVDFEIYPQGFSFNLQAIVRDKCGASLDDASYTLSSDVQEQIVIDYTLDENEITISLMEQLQLGEHTLSLKATGASGNNGSDTVEVNIIENLPPSISMARPASEGETIHTDDGVEIHVTVGDEQEDLDTLRLRWTIDGQVVGGPSNPDEFGFAAFSPTALSNGCHTIEVMVLDALDQSANVTADFVLYTEEDELEAFVYLEDLDGDGWGAPASDIISCTPIDEGVPFTVQTDCDDDNPDVHPTHPDYCGDGVDSDCQSSTPLNCFPLGSLSSSSADVTIIHPKEDSNKRYEGFEMKGVGDFDGDGYDDVMVGFRETSLVSHWIPDRSNGRVHLIHGPIIGSISDLTEHARSTQISCCGDYWQGSRVFGTKIATGNDVNGDGRLDVLIGAPDAVPEIPDVGTGQGILAQEYGAAVLLTGYDGALYELDEEINLDTASTDNTYTHTNTGGFGVWTSYGQQDSETGANVDFIDDMSGDGVAEILINAPGVNQVYILRSEDMAMDDYLGSFEDSGYAYWTLDGTIDGELGNVSASGDFDGDGIGDMLLSEDSETGKVHTVFGANFPIVATGQQITSAASYSWVGGSEFAQAGTDIVALGDLDSDGDDDYAISAPGEGDGGVVYVVPGFFSAGGEFDLENPSIQATSPNAQGVIRLVGESGDRLSALSYDGDYNGDEVHDLLIGAPENSSSSLSGGAVYTMYLGQNGWNGWWDPSTGTAMADIDLTTEVSNTNFISRIASSIDGEGFGSFIGTIGSTNGDDYDDFAVGTSNDTTITYYIFNGGSF
jgi:hypothetical protein